MAEQAGEIDLRDQYQWEAGPNEDIKIPEGYINQLKHEIVVLTHKKEFAFRCADYAMFKEGAWRFLKVIIDTSQINQEGEVLLKRVTYHPYIELVNAPFMVLPAPETVTPEEAD